VYTVALIGLGNISWRLGSDPITGASLCHRDAVSKCPQTRLACAYSPYVNEVNEFLCEEPVQGYTDLDRMFLEQEIDLVSICSPSEYHFEHVMKCLDYDIPMIWLEKPVSKSVAHIEQIENRINDQNIQTSILVNFQRRYTESYQRLRALVKGGSFGEVVSVEMHYSRGIELNGVHMLDMLFFVFDDVEYELLWVEQKKSNPDFIVKINGGVVVHVIGTDVSYHNIDISVTCSLGRLSILHGGMTLRIEKQKEHELFPGFHRLCDTENKLLGVPGFDRSFDRALDDLIFSYEYKTLPKSNFKTAIHCHHLLEDVLGEGQRWL